jgi:hypothetical protein
MKTILAAAACLVFGVVAGLAVGFYYGRVTSPTPAAPASAAPTAPTPPSNFPSQSDTVEHLDGKPIALASPDAPDKPLTHTVRKSQIEAMQFGDTACSINDEPWSTRVTYMLNTDNGRYVVEGELQYRRVGGKCAFFGFAPQKIERQ